MDGYRPLKVQDAIHDRYWYAYVESPEAYDLSQKQIDKHVNQYVLNGDTNPRRPPTHLTGGATDVWLFSIPTRVQRQIDLIDEELSNLKPGLEQWSIKQRERYELVFKYGERIDLGVDFDAPVENAGLHYYEKQSPLKNRTARSLRRALAEVMYEAGVLCNLSEFWHWMLPNTQQGAVVTGEPFADLMAAELTPELETLLQDFEKRDGLYQLRDPLVAKSSDLVVVREMVPMRSLELLIGEGGSSNPIELSFEPKFPPQLAAMSSHTLFGQRNNEQD